MTEILEFHIEIPKRVLGDDIVGNFRIPRVKKSKKSKKEQKPRYSLL